MLNASLVNLGDSFARERAMQQAADENAKDRSLRKQLLDEQIEAGKYARQEHGGEVTYKLYDPSLKSPVQWKGPAEKFEAFKQAHKAATGTDLQFEPSFEKTLELGGQTLTYTNQDDYNQAVFKKEEMEQKGKGAPTKAPPEITRSTVPGFENVGLTPTGAHIFAGTLSEPDRLRVKDHQAALRQIEKDIAALADVPNAEKSSRGRALLTMRDQHQAALDRLLGGSNSQPGAQPATLNPKDPSAPEPTKPATEKTENASKSKGTGNAYADRLIEEANKAIQLGAPSEEVKARLNEKLKPYGLVMK